MKLGSIGKILNPSARRGETLTRETIARMFLRGEGIEIGALQFPLPLPRGARVKYVDRMSVPDLRAQYPELEKAKLVEVGVIDDGERLNKFGDASLDFVVANHFLEHCEDPIRAIENFLRVLKAGGIVFLAVPDKRFTFDRDRPLTTLDHLRRDYREGAEGSRRGHYVEWIRVLHKVTDDAWAENRIQHLMATRYSIHFHVWTQAELLELFSMLRGEMRFPFEVKLFAALGEECVCVLEKGGEEKDLDGITGLTG